MDLDTTHFASCTSGAASSEPTTRAAGSWYRLVQKYNVESIAWDPLAYYRASDRER